MGFSVNKNSLLFKSVKLAIEYDEVFDVFCEILSRVKDESSYKVDISETDVNKHLRFTRTEESFEKIMETCCFTTSNGNYCSLVNVIAECFGDDGKKYYLVLFADGVIEGESVMRHVLMLKDQLLGFEYISD